MTIRHYKRRGAEPTFRRTDAERDVGITPTNYQYEPGNVLRYGTNTTPGTTDMTASIQAACDSGHKHVHIPAGTYTVSHVDLPDGVLVTGVRGETTISNISGTTARYAHGDAVFACNLVDADSDSDPANNKRGITIRGIEFVGNSVVDGFLEVMALIGMQAVSDVLIEDCDFLSPQGDAIAFYSGTLGAAEKHCQNLTIRNCFFDGVNYDNRQGISFYDVDTALVEGCRFTRLTRSNMPGAIDFEGRPFTYTILRNIRVVNCRFDSIGSSGTKPGVKGYFWQTDTLTTPHQNFKIENCSFTNCAGVDFKTDVTPSDATPSHNVAVSDCNFIDCDPNIVDGIKGLSFVRCAFEDYDSSIITVATNFRVYDLQFDRCAFKNCAHTSSGDVIPLQRTTGIDVLRNTFTDCGLSAGTDGSCVTVDSGATTTFNLLIKDNEVYSTNTRTKYLFTTSASVDFKSFLAVGNKIFTSGTGAAEETASTSAPIGNFAIHGNLSNTGNGYIPASVPNDFPVGETMFSGTGTGVPGSFTACAFRTTILPRGSSNNFQGGRQVAWHNTDLTRMFARFSNTDGTAWSAWQTVSLSSSAVASDGDTGGTGSAGAGNQYVELEIGGTTYKVLHDGTV